MSLSSPSFVRKPKPFKLENHFTLPFSAMLPLPPLKSVDSQKSLHPLLRNQSGLENDYFLFRDSHFSARPRIAADAPAPNLHLEHSKIPEFYGIAALQAFKNNIQGFLNDFFDVLLGQIGLI